MDPRAEWFSVHNARSNLTFCGTWKCISALILAPCFAAQFVMKSTGGNSIWRSTLGTSILTLWWQTAATAPGPRSGLTPWQSALATFAASQKSQSRNMMSTFTLCTTSLLAPTSKFKMLKTSRSFRSILFSNKFNSQFLIFLDFKELLTLKFKELLKWLPLPVPDLIFVRFHLRSQP